MLRVIALLFFCLTALPASAVPRAYLLDTARSEVQFTYMSQGATQRGEMPVAEARMLLDLDNLPASRVTVVLNPARARAASVFATEAMKSPGVLDTARHPRITFEATGIEGGLSRAMIRGNLTIRGVTRPVTLQAQLGRQAGTQTTDRRNLIVLLSGVVNRSDFGATGMSAFVGDQIGLRIVAYLTQAPN